MRFGASKFIILLILLISAGVIWSVFKSNTPGEIRNVILISIDTCRADHLSCYGYSRKTTPNIDAVVAEGILFENAVTPVPLTLPAHASMLTGTIPPYHGVHDNTDYSVGAANLTLAEMLKEGGFTTAAVVGAFVMDSRFGLVQGFDYYDDYVDDKETGSNVISERRAEKISQSACNWMGRNKDKPFFLFLHFFDPHFPYEPPDPFASKFSGNPYAGEIAYVDHCIGQVINRLKELKLYGSTLLIITSDHGEALGEHGEVTHGYFVYESSIKVPLIFRLPGGPRAQKIGKVVGLIDIVPTILSILKIEVPKEVQGKDLSGCFRGELHLEKERFLFCESLMATAYQCNPLLGVVSDGWKYIQTTRPELYDISKDPQEMNNLIDKQPHRARLMKGKLNQTLETRPRIMDDSRKLYLDPDSTQRLESLGYVSTGRLDESFEFDQKKDDPKDYITFHAEQYHVLQFIHERKFEQARRICERMISEHPDVAYSYFLSGNIAFAEGKFDDAKTYYSKAIELKPDFRKARCRLAATYARIGELADAVTQWKQALRLWEDDLKVHIDIADALIRLGRVDEAIENWVKSLQLKPDQPNIHNKLAIWYYKKQRVEDAVRHWKEALKMRPNWPKLLNDLAWVYTTEENPQFYKPSKAIELAERACKLTQYKRPEVLDTLSVAYASAGRFSEAIEMAQKALDLARSSNRPKLVKEIENHLKQYQSNRL